MKIIIDASDYAIYSSAEHVDKTAMYHKGYVQDYPEKYPCLGKVIDSYYDETNGFVGDAVVFHYIYDWKEVE